MKIVTFQYTYIGRPWYIVGSQFDKESEAF